MSSRVSNITAGHDPVEVVKQELQRLCLGGVEWNLGPPPHHASPPPHPPKTNTA